MLGRQTASLAIGRGLLLGSLRVLERIDARFNDRDALCKFLISWQRPDRAGPSPMLDGPEG